MKENSKWIYRQQQKLKNHKNKQSDWNRNRYNGIHEKFQNVALRKFLICLCFEPLGTCLNRWPRSEQCHRAFWVIGNVYLNSWNVSNAIEEHF